MSRRIYRWLLSSFAALAAAVPLARTSGGGMPGATAPFSGVPPVDARAVRSRSSQVRRSLSASLAEGVLAEMVAATAGAAMLMGWALYLGCSPLVISILGALPFTAQFVQLPSAWLTSAFGYRKVALWAVGASRQIFWPLVVLPYLPLGLGAKQTVLVTVAALAAGLGVVGNNAWVAWMGELVPQQLRGRYFGKRTALCTLGGTLTALAAGVLLDSARARSLAGPALGALALVAVLAGLGTTLLMRRQHQPSVDGGRGPFRLAPALQPFRDPGARKYLAFNVGWNLAIGISSTFFAVHMLENLGMGFALMAAYNASAAGVKILAAPFWGKAIDRLGARTVLTFCSFGVALVPLFWLFARPGFLWPLAAEVFVNGVMWSGHGLATFAVPLSVAPRKDRQFYLAAFATVGGLAFALAAATGGLIVGALPRTFELGGHSWYAMQVVFLTSSLGRVAGGLLTRRIVAGPSKSLGELVGFAGAEARATVTDRVRVGLSILRR